MNKINLIVVGMIVLFIIPLINAEVQSLPTQKQNMCVSLEQTCASCTYVNVDSVKYPNSSREFFNDAMTNNGGYGYSYDFCKTNQTGNYIVTTCGDVDGTDTCVDYDFEVTGNGKPNASGGIIIIFMIVIVIIASSSCFFVLYSIGHLLRLDFDIVDLAIDWGIFIALIMIYYLQNYYLGNSDMEHWLLISLPIGGILLVFIPLIAFLLSITIGSLNKKSINVGQPPTLRYRRNR
jgi:hypothetical protein